MTFRIFSVKKSSIFENYCFRSTYCEHCPDCLLAELTGSQAGKATKSIRLRGQLLRIQAAIEETQRGYETRFVTSDAQHRLVVSQSVPPRHSRIGSRRIGHDNQTGKYLFMCAHDFCDFGPAHAVGSCGLSSIADRRTVAKHATSHDCVAFPRVQDNSCCRTRCQACIFGLQ